MTGSADDVAAALPADAGETREGGAAGAAPVDASAHFSYADPSSRREPTAPGRFVEVAAIDPVELVPGLEFRPVLGERTMVNFVRFAPHTLAPEHAHEEEQIVIVLEGEFDFELGGEVRTMRRGDVAVIPAMAPHAAWTNDEACLEADVFTPPRESLLAHARAQRDKLAAPGAASAETGG